MPYYPAYAYYGQAPAILPPSTLPFEEGQTIPSGYLLKTRSVRSLVITGSISFGISYLISILTGATVVSSNRNDGMKLTPMFAPVVGPFIAIGTAKADGAGTLWLVLDGLAQTAGLTMLIYGLKAEEKFLEREPSKTSALDVVLHPEVRIGPQSGFVRWSF